MLSVREITCPKVLVLCQNKIQPFTGGGVVLSNLFGGFPADKLLFFHRDHQYNYETPYCEHRLAWQWLRPNIGVWMVLFVKWIIESIRLKKRLDWRDLPRLFVQSCHIKFPRKIDRIVRRFQPDVLYGWAGDSLWAETVSHIAVRYKLPYVIHFMDNHVGIEPETAFERAVYPVFQKQLERLAKSAVSIYTISESMGKAYNKLWGRPCEVFHGVIDSAAWPLPNEYSKSDDIFRIVFSGSIERGQLMGLQDVAGACDSLNQKGNDVRLVLYLTEKYAESVIPILTPFHCVEILPHPDFSSLRGELAKADLLVLAYGFEERTINYYRHSFATKVVPYMLSGRPILVYGPAEIEPVDYARRGGWAAVVDTNNEEILMQEIEKLMLDIGRRQLLAVSAWETGRFEHDLGINSRRFQRSMMSIAEAKII